MTDPCPSDYGLEAHQLSRGSSPLSAHIQDCKSCQARLATMEKQGREFRTVVFPATVDAILPTKVSWLNQLRPALWMVPAMGVAMVVVVLLRPFGPPQDYLGVKGSPIELLAFVNTRGNVQALSEGAVVDPSSELRFKVRTDHSCHLWIVSVDVAGEVSRLFPASGEEDAEISGMTTIPGGAVLDGKAGPERLFAVCAPSPLPFQQIAEVARAAIAPGEATVRRVTMLTGLPPQTVQSTLLLEKRR
jgi:hypothetical protein